MRIFVPAMLLVAAVIHLLPVSGVLGADRLTALYGVPMDDPNLEILMRHRAVLFGLLASFLFAAAFSPRLRGMAFGAGFVSVVSFLYLAASADGHNPLIGRVLTADVIALACLAAGFAAWLRERRGG